MSREYTTSYGSGTIPHVQSGPALDLAEGMFPVPDLKKDLNSRTGTGAVILNPEDFSVHVGLRTQAITVETTAIPIPSNPLEYRRALVIHNTNASSDVFIGGSNVTAANGLPLKPNEKIAIDIGGNPNVTVYAISGGSVEIRILELA